MAPLSYILSSRPAATDYKNKTLAVQWVSIMLYLDFNADPKIGTQINDANADSFITKTVLIH